MSTGLTDIPDHYDDLVARQIEQYKEMEIMHDLPAIYEYISSRFMTPNGYEVTGYHGVIDLYAGNFQRSLRESNSMFLCSIGSGDCSLEIQIVKTLLQRKEKNFFFICCELSPILIEKARKQIDAEGLGDVMAVARIDINKWEPKWSFAGVMAHHSLHHMLDLEHLFGLIKANLEPKGRFVTCDIIGRNGHMRWPEALVLIRKIWQKLPRKYKFNHQLNQYDDYFDNWDCATEGFEGIRAQDILPLLVRTFSFEKFFCYGNLIDHFIGRGFGPNYDATNPLDTAFIDYVQELDEQLISNGILKPTSMIAVMVNEPVDKTSTYKHWAPAFAIRDPDQPPPPYDIGPLLKGIPYQLTTEDLPLIARKVQKYSPGTELSFTSTPAGRTITGVPNLTYGWSTPESGFTWSNCEDAAILFPLKAPVTGPLSLTLKFSPYQSPLYKETVVRIAVNGSEIQILRYDNAIRAGFLSITLQIPEKSVAGADEIEIAFSFPTRRLPQFEPGGDLRSLGMALASANLSR